MAERSDGAPDVRHASRVTQRGFTMIPNAVMLRRDLSPPAKLVYGYLKHLAWRSGGEDQAEADPPRTVIATDLNMNEKAVTNCVRELQRAPVEEGDESDDAPRLLVAVRRGQGKTNAYVLNDPVEADDVPESGRSRKAESAVLESRDGANHARARQPGEEELKTEGQEISPDPPAVVLVNGRNLPLDAIAEVTGITEGSPRMMQAVVALNGKKGQAEQGIRALYWGELRRWADANGRHDRLRELLEDPAQFADFLARAIRRRGQTFTEQMPGIVFGPGKLRDWFLDLDGLAANREAAAEDDGFDWGDA